MLLTLFILIICSIDLSTTTRDLQAFLDQLKDEIIISKRTTIIQIHVQRMRENDAYTH